MTTLSENTRIECTNGHHICTTAQDLKLGHEQSPLSDWKDWQQPMPKIGTPCPINCEICGAVWMRNDTRGGVQVYTERGKWWP